MSEIKVNSIKGVSASTAAISIDNSSGTCTANITNNLSNRNLIINGAMQVAQRGTSDSTTNGNGTVDRFQLIRSGVDENPTQEQVGVSSGTTPYTLGFRNAFKVTNGNQTSVGTSDYITMRYKIEAQDIAGSGWNYLSSSSYITFSFWVKSSVAQNFYGYLKTSDGTAQMYSYETGSLTANTWTKITKTIAGNSNLQFDNDNAIGLEIYLSQFWGTDRTGSFSLDAWRSYNGAGRTPDFTSTWYTTNDATFEITGVQLEVGSVATDFEHRSYAQELSLCLRYYQIVRAASITAASDTAARFNCPLLCKTRHPAPSVGKFGTENINIGDMVSVGSNSSATPSSDGYSADDLMMSCQVTGFSGLTQYRQYCHEPVTSRMGLIAVDAEL